REHELGTLEGAIDAVTDGVGGAVLIQAATGLGKTALLRAGIEMARARELTVLHARATQLDSAYGLGLARQLFGGVLGGTPDDGGGDERERVAEQVRRILQPDLIASGTPSSSVDPDGGFGTLNALYWLLAALAEDRPVVVAVDDAHWADGPSARFLGFTASRLESVPVLLLVAAREEPEGAVAEALQTVAGVAGFRLLEPTGWSPSAVARWIEAAAGVAPSEGSVAAVHQATGGYPLLVEALVLEALREGIALETDAAQRIGALGPRAVARSVEARLAGVGDQARAVAHALMVLGDGVDLTTLATMVGATATDVQDALASLVTADLVVLEPAPAFKHAVVRAAIEDGTSADVIVRGHARAAALLREAGAPSAAVAAHLLRTAPAGDRAAVATLRAAAARAVERGAPDIAVTYLERAVAEPPGLSQRSETLRELGDAALLTGRPEALEHHQDALEAAQDARQTALARRSLAHSMLAAGRRDEAIAALQRAADEAAPEHPAIAMDVDVEIAASAQMDLLPAELAAARLARHSPPPAARTAPERGLLGVMAFEAIRCCRPVDEARRLARLALGDGAPPPPGAAVSSATWLTTRALLFAEDHEPLRSYCERVLADARLRGAPLAAMSALVSLAELHLQAGELAEADRYAAEARTTEGLHLALVGPLISGIQVRLAAERSGTAAAREELTRSGLLDLAPEHVYPTSPLYERACVRLADGDAEGAAADFAACGDRQERSQARCPAPVPWRSGLAVALVRSGDQARARELIATDLELLRDFGAPGALGLGLRRAGAVFGGQQGVAALQEAVDVLEGSVARLEHAHALCDLGAALRRAGERNRARDLLRLALDRANALGASALADRAREELGASGARLRREAARGADALTPAERRVAELVAEGLTNRAIAQRLFVSLKTVDTHLRQIFRKLEVSARGDVGAELARASPPSASA
ncbi:AAA family ATPase, partial [Paraconexibacter sp.]|uniref:helix-turn-helix transcriptional regulator n=1 Tax=Paraconexibacter sp. TaxID=2949640 RepID=UPI003565F24D